MVEVVVSALEDARAALGRAERLRDPHNSRRELDELHDAIRALIRHAEHMAEKGLA